MLNNLSSLKSNSLSTVWKKKSFRCVYIFVYIFVTVKIITNLCNVIRYMQFKDLVYKLKFLLG